MLKHACLLVALCGILWGATCGLTDLRGPDEGRYTHIAVELLGKSNWFRLTVNDVPYDQKPPLPFWTIAQFLKLAGGHVSSWAARMPAVIMGILTVLLVYLLGRHASGGNPKAGLASALILIAMPAYCENVPQAELNVPYTFWITLALALWLLMPREQPRMGWARALAFWLALAGAFFTKGPLVFVIVLSVIVFAALQERSWKPLLAARPLPGILLLGLLIAGWFAAEADAFGMDFVRQQIRGETVGRVIHGAHAKPFGYYFPRLFIAMFPWFFLALACGVWMWRRRGQEPARRLHPYAVWACAPFILLCLASGKRQAYLLPLVPAVAVMAGCFAVELAERLRHPERAARISGGIALAVGIVSLLVPVVLTVRPGILAKHGIGLTPWVTAAMAATALGLCLVGAVIMARGRSSRMAALYAVFAIMYAVGLARFTVLDPLLDPIESTRAFASSVEAYGERCIGAFGDAADPYFHIYGSYDVVEYRNKSFEQDTAEGDLPRVLIAPSDGFMRIAQEVVDLGYVLDNTLTYDEHSFDIYVRPKDDTLAFTLIGDAGTGSDEVYLIAEQMARDNRRTSLSGIFMLGDNVYKGSFSGANLQRVFMAPFGLLHRAGVPFYAILGNHDYDKGRAKDELASPLLNMEGKRYSIRTFGCDLITFFLLDSESLCEEGDEEQLDWLRNGLASCRSKWRIVLLHRPIVASRIGHGPERKLYRMLYPILAAKGAGISAVIAGHNHVYERSVIGADGILHMTVGSSGQTSDETFRDDAGRAFGYTSRAVYVRLLADAASLRFAAINEDGQVVDTVELPRAASPAAPAAVYDSPSTATAAAAR